MNQRVEPLELVTAVPVKRRHWFVATLRFLLQLVLPLAILAGGWQVYTSLRDSRAAVPQRPSVERARPIDVIAVSPGTVTPTLSLYGQIVAGRSVDLRVLAGGAVTEVSSNLAEGGVVAPNETLVVVDDFDATNALGRARADLAESTARVAELEARAKAEASAAGRAAEQVTLAESEVERVTRLNSSGNATRAAVETAETRLSQARAAFEARDSQAAILDAQKQQVAAQQERLRIAVAQAERARANTRLVAPFGGIISNVGAEVGRNLNTNDRIATLVDPTRFEVRFTLADAQYARLAGDGGGLVGRTVTIAWNGPDGRVERSASVTRVAPQVEATAGGYEVFAALSSVEATVRPGAFVEVAMPDAPYTDALMLPQSAVQEGAVFIVVDERLKRVPVAVIGYAGENVIVRGEIAPGARVLTTRLTDAADGLLVSVRS